MTSLAAALLAACTANVNTTGFGMDGAVFESLRDQNLRQVDASISQNPVAAAGLNAGTCVRIATRRNYTQGQLTNTGNSLDVAINGRGFLQVLMPDGSAAYTRDGAFQMNSDGELATADGYRLLPAISIPADAHDISIAADGTVGVLLGDQTVPAIIGTIQLTDFVNPAGLQPRGVNLLVESVASGPARTGNPARSGFGELQQGFLEVPNVDMAEDKMLQHVSNTL